MKYMFLLALPTYFFGCTQQRGKFKNHTFTRKNQYNIIDTMFYQAIVTILSYLN